ncbi:4'-phosphopantetheinyl transferase superfamily [Absidia repens]|uniref:holo-[acyl-carrier-protein] synthase n=1 Tax=Absidia repens TaxID=90262 RepID=A0A1X2J2Q4_9FUNG|nr:4'-phosphopantetheinyl transferase superfamily [Absidia repens]
MNLPITLLSFNITDIGDKFHLALNRLPPTEHASILRYKFGRDRQLALAGRLLRRYYYSKTLGIPWNKLEFFIQPDGKPALVHPQGKSVDFNISHDGNWVIFGATEIPTTCIGVDVVWINPDTYGPIDDFISSFNSQLTVEEQELLAKISNEETRLTTFYQIWGLKESYIKAIGKGLALDLDQFCILPQQQRQQTYQQRNQYKDQHCFAQPTSRVDADNSIEQKNAGGTERTITTTTTTTTARAPQLQQGRTRLVLRTKGQNRDKHADHWCIHLGYLDSQSISVVCCGSKIDSTPLDEDLVQLGNTTLGLGDMYNEQQQASIFTRLDLDTLLSNTPPPSPALM